MRYSAVRSLCFLFLAGPLLAQDPQLEMLRSTLAGLRSHSDGATVTTRGARSELTLAKHQLRDWIESRLAVFDQGGDERSVEVEINKALDTVKLPAVPAIDGLFNDLGSVTGVRLHRESRTLVVTTGLGILCGVDDSAYAYEWKEGRWQRFWEAEQNDYTSEKTYKPRSIDSVHVWAGAGREPHLVLTLGTFDWCTSNWRAVYYQLWQVDPSGSKLLINEDEPAFLGDRGAMGSVRRERLRADAPINLLIEFAGRSIDSGRLVREVVRNYSIQGDHIQRIDPVALSPGDFADEWLIQPWTESAAWSSAAGLEKWHQKLHADWVGGDFDYPASMHCQTPDLWQVGFTPADEKKNFEPKPEVYFLVRWRPPYHFTMAEVADKPWPGCDQPDPEADEWRTLFSDQEWRQYPPAILAGHIST